MSRSPGRRQRKWIALGVLSFVPLAVYWVFFSAGMPVWFGPSASAKDIAQGRELFEHEWTPNDPMAHGDGLGPVFNARSCVACHFQGGVGGGGEAIHNATHFEATGGSALTSGTVHNFSVNPEDRETIPALRKQFPVRRGQVSNDGHCGPQRSPDVDPLRTESVQSAALFGIGWIDRISEKAILRNFRGRSASLVAKEFSLKFDGVPVGRLRTLPDGSIGRFGWKAQASSLKDFVATACANEIGLGTPYQPQSTSFVSTNAPEVVPDLDKKQFKALLAFVDTLPRPEEVTPATEPQRSVAAKGKELFGSVGCAVCHVPDMGGVKGVYSDFLMYTLDEPQPNGPGGGYAPEPPELPRSDDEPRGGEWKTPALWGVADSAPYFHDGATATLSEAILRHKGDAKSVTEKYKALPPADQAAVVAFLQTLKAPSAAAPLADKSVTHIRARK